MGLGLISESCCYLSNEDVEERKKIIEQWIEANLIMGKQNGNFNGEKAEKWMVLVFIVYIYYLFQANSIFYVKLFLVGI